MVVGLIQPDKGQVLLDDRDVTDLPIYTRARAGISYLPQEMSVFRRLTVEDNLLAILETLGISRSEQQDRKDRLLADFRLSYLAKN